LNKTYPLQHFCIKNLRRRTELPCRETKIQAQWEESCHVHTVGDYKFCIGVDVENLLSFLLLVILAWRVWWPVEVAS